jgi:ankyrin repeat domain-containing protein 50
LHRPGEILARLGKLPKDLRQTYDEIYNSMKDHEKEIADRAFQWVMCAAEPLQTKVLLPAICQDENSDTLAPLDGLDEDLALEYCHNLLVIDPVRKVWVPSHLSVIEYMENRWSLSQANCLVTSICLLVLQNTVLYNREESWCSTANKKRQNDHRAKLLKPPEKSPSEEEGASKGAMSSIGEEVQNTLTGSLSTRSIELSDPLHLDEENFKSLSLYARHSWKFHAQRSAQAGSKQRVSTLLHEFLGHPAESSAAYRCWLRMAKVDDEGSEMIVSQRTVWNLEPKIVAPDSAASFVYCLWDLAGILPDWHDYEWIKLEQRTIDGYSCLELAVIGGAFHTCRELIKHGASVNDQTESYYGSALAVAASMGDVEVVELLVKEGGADVNMQLQCGDYGSALAAAARGYKNRAVVEFLVKEGEADVNIQLQYGKYGSALAAATNNGYQEVVEFLVKEGGADVNLQLQFGYYGSALAAAAAEGDRNRRVVEFLVKEGGADVNMQLQHGEYGSALAAAVAAPITEDDDEDDWEDDDEDDDEDDVWWYTGQIIEFLVKEGGAEVNMQLEHGKYANALDAAEKNGTSEIVQLLIQLGAKRQEQQHMVLEEEKSFDTNVG